jgi:hypothetical protein
VKGEDFLKKKDTQNYSYIEEIIVTFYNSNQDMIQVLMEMCMLNTGKEV